MGLVEVTPWKIHMEPTNHPFRKENDLNQTSRELCSMLIFRVYFTQKTWSYDGPLLGPTGFWAHFPWFRWQHPTALPKTKMNHQSKDATDHCSTPFLHQLRTGPSDFYLRGTSFFAWSGLVCMSWRRCLGAR